jgi:hypothetical protein
MFWKEIFLKTTLPLPIPSAGLRVNAMAAEEKSRIGLCGLAVMGQVRGGRSLRVRYDTPKD